MIDELERLQAFRGDVPPPSDDVRRTARANLTQMIANAAARERTARARARRRRAWVARGVLVTAAATLAVVLIDLSGSGAPTAPSTAAAEVLKRLAVVAARQPQSAPGPGQYLYVESESAYPSDYNGRCTILEPGRRQIWIGADQSGRLRETSGTPSYSSQADRATCKAMGVTPPADGQVSDTWFAPQCLSLGPTNDFKDLPTEPEPLLEAMRRLDGGPHTAAEDFVHVGDFLRETSAPPAIRAALYRAAATIPGVHLLGLVRDHAGRQGLGLALDGPQSRSELIFDPNTSALLGEQVTTSDGRLADWAVYLRTRIVDRIPGTVPKPLRPPCLAGAGTGHELPSGVTVVTG